MEQPKVNWPRNFRNVTIKMTDGSIIKGKINIKETGRLSQFFKEAKEDLLTVVPEEDSKKVFIINKRYIFMGRI